MRSLLGTLQRRDEGAAAAELALVMPLLLALMFGSVELSNLFMDQHALEKQVRDGARYAARMSIDPAYSCPGTVFNDPSATTKIINVTKTGAVSGAGTPRWPVAYWARTCTGGAPTVAVNIRCVAKNQIDTANNGFSGIYTSLPGTTIPVVKVSAAVKYRSFLALIGFNATNICMTAESEAPVQGL
ncbi:MAG: TadE/TadG family type IV pilus assembly protein [Sphingomicrobium sp.]